MIRPWIIFVMMMFAAQSAVAYPASYGHVLSTRLNLAAAKTDAVREAKSGNCKLFALRGYNLSVPHKPKNAKAYKIFVIDDTTDALGSEADIVANKTGRAYADIYNATSVSICSRRKK
jgi:hypothetical protein